MLTLAMVGVVVLSFCGTLQAQNTQAAMNTAWDASQAEKNNASDSYIEYTGLLGEIYTLLYGQATNNLSESEREELWCEAEGIDNEFQQGTGNEYREAGQGINEWTYQQYLAAREDGPTTYELCAGYCDILEDMWTEIDADIEEFICRLETVKQAAQANL